MRKILFTLLFILPIYALGQEDGTLKSFIYDILNQKNKIYQSANEDSLKGFTAKALRRSFDYLSKYDTDSAIYNHFHDYSELLRVYMTHIDKSIRNKAFHLFLDTYRLNGGFSGHLQIKPDDVDNKIKAKILNIISNKPYSEKELKVLTTKKEQYYKQVYTDKYLLKHRRIDTTIMSLSYARDSLIHRSMIEFSESLKTPSCDIEILSELCAWLYIYEAVPYIEKYLETHNNNRRLKVHLARLGNKYYEDELIKDNLSKKFLAYEELAYLNSPKSKVAMIQGLRIEGRSRGFISAYKQGKFVSEEVDGAFYKLSNLDLLLLGHYFTIEIPFEGNRYINNEDISLFPKCEEVAKWMEENIDKLEINPNLRF